MHQSGDEKNLITAPLISTHKPATRSKAEKWVEFFAYGLGHFFNDLCASLWFTYLLLFYHSVIQLGNSYAGLLLLIGQVADGICTPIIGMASDHTKFKYYGRRKIWHLIGTISVFISFSFIWYRCLLCDVTKTNSLAVEMVYYSVFIIIFQFGWASVQISHLSLIPEITSNESERVSLNSIRYFFTILANLTIFGVLAALFGFSGDDDISPNDLDSFWFLSLGTIGVGAVFSILFHIGVRESTDYKSKEFVPESSHVDTSGRSVTWYQWFLNPEFYFVAVMYMCTRLVVNISQVYISLYLIDSLDLSKLSVAFSPLVIYVSGLITTLSMKYVNLLLGRELTYFVGLGFIWAAIETFWVIQRGSLANLAYLGSSFLGIGGSAILVTALSMTSDLIGSNTGTGAFVYGAMSFTDKLSNGVVIQVIQLVHPCKGEGEAACCSLCSPFYRYVMVSVPGVSSLIAYFGLCALILTRFFMKKRKTERVIQ
ncbi:Major facilitator superfamily domain-containing protein 12 [Oopsacas minuta]|uniref:Major facilitator superfamily domain-containing protein 12 n=1 Tax=Oopsacas minuta TaxID=111878 RepID=A0AAV7K6N9_9METZ|nr:Major facilitator superfamily domain-containing protein 12 [Oopsacas minuta]